MKDKNKILIPLNREDLQDLVAMNNIDFTTEFLLKHYGVDPSRVLSYTMDNETLIVEIKSRSMYSDKEIDSSLYEEIKIDPNYQSNGAMTYIPYLIKERDPNDTDTTYEDFMKKYREDHKYCPKCGAVSHSSTFVGYVFNRDNPEEYKDLNRCVCQECNDIHTYHDRI